MHNILVKVFLFLATITLLLSFSSVHSSFAADIYSLQKESVNPGDDISYIIKRVREKINLLILSFSSTKKVAYYLELTNVRLNELGYVVNKKDIANIETTSKRYAATGGQFSDFILSKNLSDYKEKAKNLFNSHIYVLEKLRDTYPYSSSEYRFVQDDINSLNSFITRLK